MEAIFVQKDPMMRSSKLKLLPKNPKLPLYYSKIAV